jgi:hypothetical protein
MQYTPVGSFVRRVLAGVALCSCLLLADRADGVEPESLLSKDSLLYLRYDGLESHRAAYDRTVLARLMREDLGQLVSYVTRLAQDALGPEVLSERLLAGATPAKLLTLQKAAKGLPNALEFLYRHGAMLGLEVVDPAAPRWQATIVFPAAGKEAPYRDGLLGAVRFGSLVADADLQTTKVGGRDVQTFERESVKLSVWQEGDHVVLTVGTEEPGHTLGVVEGKRPTLTASESYRRLTAFKSYETWTRGYVDLAGARKLAEKVAPPEATALVEKLGLDGLTGLSLHSGCEDRYLRRTLILETTAERTGLVRLLSAPQPLGPEQLPSLPADVTSFYATRIDWGATVKTLLEAQAEIAKVAGPEANESLPDDLIKEIEKAQSAFGSGIVLYNAPSQGPLSLGYTLALEVKDAEKLKGSIQESIHKAAAKAGAEYETKTRKYRGVDLYLIRPRERLMPFTPTYTVHDGWFVASLNPQPVQAYILRTTGGKEHTRWVSPDVVAQAVRGSAKATGGKLASIDYSDPRPTIELLCNWVPLFAAYAERSVGVAAEFDVSLMPNSRSINDLIGPRLTVGWDDGQALRWERTSTFPLDMSFLEIYGLLGAFGAGFSLGSGEKEITSSEAQRDEIGLVGDKRATVSGTITLDGKPVAEGRIGFHPAKGKPAVAEIKEGAYSTGMLAGTMAVTIEYSGAPKKFSDPKASLLRATIKPGKNTLNFDLTSN